MNLPLDSNRVQRLAGPTLRFRHVALVGKYHAVGSRDALENIAHFLHAQGCEVSLERDTALNTGLTHYQALDVAGIGAQCDLALVMGGDGTMLGIARQLARYQVPVVGINQGRLGFITDIPLGDYEACLRPMLRGEYQEDARALINNGVQVVAEAANMPCTPDAVELFLHHKVLYAPGKAANAGGVATSGLEMSQNALHLGWPAEEVEERLKGIMKSIHDNAYQAAKEFGSEGNYVVGANIAGFVKVADAMLAHGVI